jgi:hypothetical protein
MKFIQKVTRDAGVDVTEYVRNSSLNNVIRPRLTEDQSNIYLKLAGMANNLNQLAKAANGREILTREILKALEQINEAISKLT